MGPILLPVPFITSEFFALARTIGLFGVLLSERISLVDLIIIEIIVPAWQEPA